MGWKNEFVIGEGLKNGAGFVNGTEGGTTNLAISVNGTEMTNPAAFVNGWKRGKNKPCCICK
jgi:hypothetical protein